jgi:hypothetical protein
MNPPFSSGHNICTAAVLKKGFDRYQNSCNAPYSLKTFIAKRRIAQTGTQSHTLNTNGEILLFVYEKRL